MKLDGQRLSTAEIKVVTSGAFRAAYLQLAPEYERATQVKLATEFGPSTGTARNAIPIRLERGEAIDVVIMAASGIVELITRRKIRADSRVDLVQSEIGMAVKAGASKPDVSTVEKLKQVLLAAKSIAYSDSASGVYLSTELFPRLGIADQLKLRQDIFIAEIYLEQLYRHGLRSARYQALPRFPAVERDFSFVFDDVVIFETIQNTVLGLGRSELRSFVPVEVFRGGSVAAGKYSILLRATFQSHDRTLREEEVTRWSGQIIGALEGLGGKLRG